jgi:excisionase family DNA binding protein
VKVAAEIRIFFSTEPETPGGLGIEIRHLYPRTGGAVRSIARPWSHPSAVALRAWLYLLTAMVPTFKTLLTGTQLGQSLGVSQATIDRWVSGRIIPCYKFGARCVRFDYQEVREALSKFGNPARRRLPRGTYRPKGRPKFRAEQLNLPFQWEDPSQLLLGLLPEPLLTPGSTYPNYQGP